MRYRLTQAVWCGRDPDGGLLLEAAIWLGLAVWDALGWRSLGAPSAYWIQSLAWGLLALPVAAGDSAILPRRRSWLARASLVATVVLNVALAPLAILGGVFDPGVPLVGRTVLVGIGLVAVAFIAGAVHVLRSRSASERQAIA